MKSIWWGPRSWWSLGSRAWRQAGLCTKTMLTIISVIDILQGPGLFSLRRILCRFPQQLQLGCQSFLQKGNFLNFSLLLSTFYNLFVPLLLARLDSMACSFLWILSFHSHSNTNLNDCQTSPLHPLANKPKIEHWDFGMLYSFVCGLCTSSASMKGEWLFCCPFQVLNLWVSGWLPCWLGPSLQVIHDQNWPLSAKLPQ